MAFFGSKKPRKQTHFDREFEADIIVVGAGISGVCAAQAAAEAGASVIVVEKFDAPVAHGVDIAAVNSVLHEEAGIHIDTFDAARLMFAWSQQQANYNLIRTYMERSGEVISYYYELAKKQGYSAHLNTETTARADWFDLDDRYRMFQTAHVFDPPADDPREPKLWRAQYLLEVAYNDAVERGVQFMFNHKAEQLIRDGERVEGVIATTPDPSLIDINTAYVKFTAKKGVIMATGGISDNMEMRASFCPITMHVDREMYFPRGGNMAEGHAMCEWVGGELSRCYPAPIIHPVNFTPLKPGIDSSWLMVDRKGKRFMNETAYEPAVTNGRVNVPGNKCWAIWDSNYLAHYAKMEPIKSGDLPENTAELVEQAVVDGVYFKGETLEELANNMGIPADNLVATVERYNTMVDKGEDTDFGVPERFLSECRVGPFYAGQINAECLAIIYGMRVDENSQLLDEDENPIPGLYAVGNMQGDFFANSYPVTCPGTSNGRSVTFGRLVGQALAKGENIDGSAIA